MIKPEVRPGVRPGVRTVPLQRSGTRSAPAVARVAAEPLLDTEPARLSAKEVFCLGFAFSAALLIFGGGAAAAIDDGVPPAPQTAVTAR